MRSVAFVVLVLMSGCYEHQLVDPFDASTDTTSLSDRRLPDTRVLDTSIPDTRVPDNGVGECTGPVPDSQPGTCSELAACRQRICDSDGSCQSSCISSLPGCGPCITKPFLECAIDACPAEAEAVRCCLERECNEPNDLVGSCQSNECIVERDLLDRCVRPFDCFQRDTACF